MTLIDNYSLRAHNTFGIDAQCSCFAEYATTEEACQLAEKLKADGRRLLIIGSGSNLLLTADYPGIAIHSAIHGLSVSRQGNDIYVRAGSGMRWDDLVARCVSNGWHGMENLSLIPGEVGASAVQNIGAYGAEASHIIYKVEAVSLADGSVCEMKGEECHYGYRDSRFKHEWKNQFLITHVTYRLSARFTPQLDYGNIRSVLQQQHIEAPTAQQLRDTIIGIRRAKLPDPELTGNAGSFFMNPVVGRAQYLELAAAYPQMPHYQVDEQHEKIPAGWLIEQCGWKGQTVGHAGVHDKQALVLVNRGGATGQEIADLAYTICQDVERKFGIQIKPEVNII